eukprot:TRINITY_DN7091_c0_g1_i1.p1 TRINITY_DN7091_c0_g1~~TRINITY_DN7091_c0_g1_i1.p1  ORF type:complete len:135 (+),score=40.88 TRINITY_DN7091_c0_g1_i1:51-407(+)
MTEDAEVSVLRSSVEKAITQFGTKDFHQFVEKYPFVNNYFSLSKDDAKELLQTLLVDANLEGSSDENFILQFLNKHTDSEGIVNFKSFRKLFASYAEEAKVDLTSSLQAELQHSQGSN